MKDPQRLSSLSVSNLKLFELKNHDVIDDTIDGIFFSRERTCVISRNRTNLGIFLDISVLRPKFNELFVHSN